MKPHPEVQLTLIADFAAEIIKQDDLDDILWLIIDRIIKALDFEDCVIYVLPIGTDHLIQCAAIGPKNPIGRVISNPIRIPLGKGIVGTAALLKKVLVVDDATLDARYLVDDQIRCSEISVPIIFEDRVLGVIDSEHPEPAYFKDWHVAFLSTIANMTAARLSEILRREKLVEAQTSLRSTDATTHAQNPTYLAGMDDDASRQTLASRLSHEVKTPLNAIIGMSELLLEENTMQEMIEPLTIIQKAANNLDETLTNLLIALSPQIALKSLTDDTYALLPYLQAIIDEATTTEPSQIVLEVEDIPAQITFRGDAVQRILTILLSNALTHGGQNGATLRVALTHWQDDFGLSFQVIDTGPGIPPALRDRIFELFFQGGDFSASSGKGMGLSVAKALSERVNGQLALLDQDKGTCFELIVPARLIAR